MNCIECHPDFKLGGTIFSDDDGSLPDPGRKREKPHLAQFTTGYFSMFDVILAIAGKNNIPLEYSFDSTRMTHFITSLNNISGEYWYRFSNDTGGPSWAIRTMKLIRPC